MARPRSAAVATISDGQASYVIERLRVERRITDADIARHLGEMSREIRDIEQRLSRLREAAGASQMGPQSRGGGETPTLSGGHKPARSVTSGRPDGSDRGTPTLKSASAKDAPSVKRPKRKFTVTAKVLASREIQGRYLPLLNKFSGRRRADFAKLAKDKGREAAISAMESALR